MTVKEALKITANNLGNISVPRALNQQIGIPIDQAIENIMACVDALEQNEREHAKETFGCGEETNLEDSQPLASETATEFVETETEEEA